MIVTQHWLKEWVDIQHSPQQLAHLLTMAGLEVESILDPVPPISRVVIGLVESIAPHPNADKLRVCTVNVGQGRILNIVCGAKNVGAHMKVPVVMVGGELPGGIKIKETELRGVLSQGMICSVSELGLAESSEGILVLPNDAPIGEDFKTYIGFPDTTFEIGLTPNRGDCLSIWGVAREIAALTGVKHRPFIAEHIPYQGDYTLDIYLKAKDACTKYVGRILNQLNPHAQTPLAMVERLRRCGLRSISPIVDVTNYVMLLTGQPLHAFDAKKVRGSITVRMAQDAEKLVLLDGAELTLSSSQLVIADEAGPIALAGIMGGQRAMVTAATTEIVLEAAHFTPLALAGKARSLGLHTDSSHRFERGVDPALPEVAISIATSLILKIAGGSCGPLLLSGEPATALPPIVLETQLIEKTLGKAISASQAQDLLSLLGFKVHHQSSSELSVQVPSHRFDVELPIDLVEEVARLFGYDQIQESELFAPLNPRKTQERAFSLGRARQILVAAGYHEAINYSFIAEKDHETFFPAEPGYRLSNPLSADLSIMRASLIPGLVKALSYNQNRQAQRVRLFEAGRGFSPLPEGGCTEHEHLAGVIWGEIWPLNWDLKVEAGFYHVKADLNQIFQTLGDQSIEYRKASSSAYLHPGKSADIFYAGQFVGVIGVLHPTILKSYKLKGQPVVFELNLDVLNNLGVLPKLKDLPKFPSVKRDLALVVDQSCSFDALVQVVRRELGSLLQSVDLFDIYQGEGLAEHKKSFALSLILQDLSHTLKEDELNLAIQRLLSALSREVGAILRE